MSAVWLAGAASGGCAGDMNLEDFFPGLVSTGYRITSPATAGYNCFAWAAGYLDAWWEPDPADDGYWPAGVPREQTLIAIVARVWNHRICDRAPTVA